jgi:hypothetical protein
MGVWGRSPQGRPPPRTDDTLDAAPPARYPETRPRSTQGHWRWRMAASVRHETRALLRAHLSAASSYRHVTRHCPICHRLLRLALDTPPPREPEDDPESGTS